MKPPLNGWIWVPLQALYVIHDRQISRHGGTPGLRDATLVETGAARAVNRARYSGADVFDIAAAYAFGIAKAHGFLDGNKRTALVAALTFLRLNGHPVRPNPVEGVRMMNGLAADRVTEADFAAWLRALTPPPQLP